MQKLVNETLANIAQGPFRAKKVKSWEQKKGDMLVKVELWQDAPNSFEVAKWQLGAGVPSISRFSTLKEADSHYALFVECNWSIESQLIEENEKLHKLCAAAQCWLDAAGFLANGHETKCALQRNADAFRQEYSKITS